MTTMSCMKLRLELHRKSGITRWCKTPENVQIVALCGKLDIEPNTYGERRIAG